MTPRDYALGNLLAQQQTALQLYQEVLELRQVSHSEEFHGGSLAHELKQKRLNKLERRRADLDDFLARIVPAWAAFGAEDYSAVSEWLSGARSEEAKE